MTTLGPSTPGNNGPEFSTKSTTEEQGNEHNYMVNEGSVSHHVYICTCACLKGRVVRPLTYRLQVSAGKVRTGLTGATVVDKQNNKVSSLKAQAPLYQLSILWCLMQWRIKMVAIEEQCSCE